MKNKFREIYLSFLVSLCLSLLIIFLVIIPLIKEIKEASVEFSLNRQKIESFSEQMASLQRFRPFSQEVKDNLAKAENLFFDAEIPVEFVNFLEDTASSSGVSIEISSVSLEEKNEQRPWSALVFNLQVSGNFSDFGEFIERIKNSPYLTEIKNISVKKISSKEKETGLSVEISSNLSLRVLTK